MYLSASLAGPKTQLAASAACSTQPVSQSVSCAAILQQAQQKNAALIRKTTILWGVFFTILVKHPVVGLHFDYNSQLTIFYKIIQ